MQKRRIRETMLMIQDILIKAMISSFCESLYLSYFRFQSNAWRDESVIFFSHKSHNEEGASFFIYHLQKKQVLQVLKASQKVALHRRFIIDNRILGIF